MTKKGIVISPIKKTHTLEFRGIVKGKLTLDDLENLDARKSCNDFKAVPSIFLWMPSV